MFAIAAVIMFGLELLFTYIKHKAIEIDRSTFKPALIGGAFSMLLSIYSERRKKKQETKNQQQ